MVRVVLSIVMGVIAGAFFMFMGQLSINLVFPTQILPSDASPTYLEQYMASVPTVNKILLVANWAICGFIAACITNFIQGRTDYKPMLLTMGLLQVMTYLNMVTLPGHPGWMWLAATIVFGIVGFISYRLLRKKQVHE